ncbi:DUF4429 domain-containing protein [Weissella confusa]|uniref:DUF4429 domain-containing protein n=1 Tax=Weissella confusa TaxID=1583 RepID=UPI00107F213B|nr:DUF4429 domain-containing protein [Weissella confusa]MBJ7620032.1 hypothetical protein [Weissella confusa]MBJ7667367.1 hypothetical protein [Weissella confusa]QBZ02836.1 hypothetical protein C6P13_06065 [Weissella confusa]TGE60293.1 hypothetical protein C6P16_06095 [Weissella confusa]TGE68461.1 hypothetical protein C6P14_06095 [Weissella confusa]
MGMFGNKEQVDLFPEVSGEKTFYIKKNKQTVRLDNNFLRIARGGAANALLQGLDGEKSILLSSITGYQLKAPGATVGYLQVNYPGSQDVKGGVFDAVKDENTITFAKEDKANILLIKQAIESAIISNN